MIKIKELTSVEGVVKGSELEFDGSQMQIVGEIGCITKTLIDRAFTDGVDKKIAVLALAHSFAELL